MNNQEYLITWFGMDGSYHEEEKEFSSDDKAIQYGTMLEDHGAHLVHVWQDGTDLLAN